MQRTAQRLDLAGVERFTVATRLFADHSVVPDVVDGRCLNIPFCLKMGVTIPVVFAFRAVAVGVCGEKQRIVLGQ